MSASRITSSLSQSYLEVLISGDRAATRKVIDNAIKPGFEPYELLTPLVWPTMEVKSSAGMTSSSRGATETGQK